MLPAWARVDRGSVTLMMCLPVTDASGTDLNPRELVVRKRARIDLQPLHVPVRHGDACQVVEENLWRVLDEDLLRLGVRLPLLGTVGEAQGLVEEPVDG